MEDHTGRVQVYLKRNVIGADAFSVLDLLDLGDWIGVEGSLFRTRMGQVTVHATGYRLLSKSLRPLPLGKVEVDGETGGTTTYSGFADRESRYRQRYADLAVNPRVRDVFRMRTRIISTARMFLDGLGFVEVETRSFSHSTAARRHARSRPATWRWTGSSTSASPTSCT